MQRDLPAKPSAETLCADVSGMRHQSGRLSVGFKEVSSAYIRSLDLSAPARHSKEASTIAADPPLALVAYAKSIPKQLLPSTTLALLPDYIFRLLAVAQILLGWITVVFFSHRNPPKGLLRG